MSNSPDQNQRQQNKAFGITNVMPISVTNLNNNNNSSIITNTINSNSNCIINNNANNTEQPQTKRQKIEKFDIPNGNKINHSSTAASLAPPPDIIDTGELKNLSSLSSPAHSITSPSSSCSSETSPSSTPSSSRAASLTQLLNVQNLNHMSPLINGHGHHHHHQIENNIMSSRITKNSNSSSILSNDEVDRSSLPDLLPSNSTVITANVNYSKLRHSLHVSPNLTASSINPHQQQQQLDELAASQDMREFEESLSRQCLCGVSERMLRKPFQSHYSLDANGQKRAANLSEWPTNKLLQFLSNLQLLFDIYLKQNSKGFICARIMDVCDALIRNDHNLIDEIIVLAGYSNAFVQFLAGRVLASFLVIAKQEMDDDWLKKLVDNLFNFDRLDDKAVQKIHFSLEIIKRIVEWKDLDLHPLEEEIADTQTFDDNMPSSSNTLFHATSNSSTIDEVRLGCLHFQAQQPSLESNYFAVHYRSNESLNDPSSSTSTAHYNSSANQHYNILTNSNYQLPQHHIASHHQLHNTSIEHQQGCHLITLTDSESFDTTHLKCITIKILENKWPALVNNMSSLISNHLVIENAENCILNFLQLWENIISVKANLSIVETLPFYSIPFKLLLNQNLSCTVYKQMLCLFNEALCYGSTLALQDMLPDETCMLAHQIVRHVKDNRILESLPRWQPENVVGLLGFKRKPVTYGHNLMKHQLDHINDDTENALNSGEVIKMDKTILQKIVLLVLKSVAVTVKEIRSDSSDSSIDSTDYDASQDMVLIERSIRDVLRKLESFIKHTLEFHPECHFSKILIHLFNDQDDHLIEAMVCTLDVTSGISFHNNAFPELVSMLNPVYTFLEFLKIISNSSDLLLDLLVSNETCFLLYLLRFLKYILRNWPMFVQSCHDFGVDLGLRTTLDEAMSVLIRLRLQISRLVSRQLYPYDISPVLRLLESCESLYEGNELS